MRSCNAPTLCKDCINMCDEKRLAKMGFVPDGVERKPDLLVMRRMASMKQLKQCIREGDGNDTK